MVVNHLHRNQELSCYNCMHLLITYEIASPIVSLRFDEEQKPLPE